MSQQIQWEDLRRTTEQLEHLSALVTQAQTNEPKLKELRRVRDLSKVLEGEYAALQRRYCTRSGRCARQVAIARLVLCAPAWHRHSSARQNWRNHHGLALSPVKFVKTFSNTFELQHPEEQETYVLAEHRRPSAAFTSPVLAPDPTQAKLGSLTIAVTSLSEICRNLVQTQQVEESGPESEGASRASPARTSALGGSLCNFCRGTGHFIQECTAVEDSIRAGKCKRNPPGKLVLPSGAMVPFSTPGATLGDRIEEWHRQNPGHGAQLLLEVTPTRTAIVPPQVASQPRPRPVVQPARAYTAEQAPSPSSFPRTVTSSQPTPARAHTQQPPKSPSHRTSRQFTTARRGLSPTLKGNLFSKLPKCSGRKLRRLTTRKLRRREEAAASYAFSIAARIPLVEDMAVLDPSEAYLRERATSMRTAAPNTSVAAESSTWKTVPSVFDSQDVSGSRQHPAPDQHACSQMFRMEDPETGLEGPAGSLVVDPATSNAFTRANTLLPDLKASDPDIATAPRPFHFDSAPRQSTSALAFLGSRTPLTVFRQELLTPHAIS